MNRATAGGWRGALFYLVQFTWGLTVNLAGLAVFLCCRKRFHSETFRNGVVTCLPGKSGGLSLGIFIFIGARSAAESGGLCAHEYGHTIQCLVLGPLYWIAVAVPSVVWRYLFDGYRKRTGIPYDALYCERWATAWGRKWGGG